MEKIRFAAPLAALTGFVWLLAEGWAAWPLALFFGGVVATLLLWGDEE